MKLPSYSCPFRNCTYATEDRCSFLHHVAGGASDTTHREQLDALVGDDMPWLTRLDYVYGAVAMAERERWPLIGSATTRRALKMVCRRYNDAET